LKHLLQETLSETLSAAVPSWFCCFIIYWNIEHNCEIVDSVSP